MTEREGTGHQISAFLMGGIVGAVAGAIAGTLLAPRSGKETREHLRETAETLAKRTRFAAEKAKEATYDRARSGAQDGVEMAGQEIEAAKAAWKAGREAWQRAHNGSTRA